MHAELAVVICALFIQSTLSFTLMYGGVRGCQTGIFYERINPIDVWASRIFGALLLCALFAAEYIQPIEKMHAHGQIAFVSAVVLGFLFSYHIRENP